MAFNPCNGFRGWTTSFIQATGAENALRHCEQGRLNPALSAQPDEFIRFDTARECDDPADRDFGTVIRGLRIRKTRAASANGTYCSDPTACRRLINREAGDYMPNGVLNTITARSVRYYGGESAIIFCMLYGLVNNRLTCWVAGTSTQGRRVQPGSPSYLLTGIVEHRERHILSPECARTQDFAFKISTKCSRYCIPWTPETCCVTHDAWEP